MSNYDAETARLWDEYKAEQADWTEDIGGEFSAVFADDDYDWNENDRIEEEMYGPNPR